MMVIIPVEQGLLGKQVLLLSGGFEGHERTVRLVGVGRRGKMAGVGRRGEMAGVGRRGEMAGEDMHNDWMGEHKVGPIRLTILQQA